MKTFFVVTVLVLLLFPLVAFFGHKSTVITGFDGIKYSVPIPLLATRQPGAAIRYTVFFPDLGYYKKFSKYGWVQTDQLGGVHIFSNGQVRLNVSLYYKRPFISELSIDTVVIGMATDLA